MATKILDAFKVRLIICDKKKKQFAKMFEKAAFVDCAIKLSKSKSRFLDRNSTLAIQLRDDFFF